MIEQLAAMPKYEIYKDSGVEWLGEIPEHWEIKRLKFIIAEHSGNGFPVEEQGKHTGELPFYKVSDIGGDSMYISHASNYVNFKTAKKLKWNLIPSGSLITAKIGEALRKNHRKISTSSSIIDNNCIAFEAVSIGVVFNYYLHKVIDFDWFTNPGAVPCISVPKYKSFHIPLPAFTEQTAIAAFLDRKTAQLDQAVAIKEKQITLFKEHKQILIQNAVTRSLNPDAPMRDSGVEWLGKIPAHWAILANRVIFRERVEPGEDGLPLLSVSIHTAVSSEEISEDENIRGRIKIEDKTKYSLVQIGDIAFNMMRAWQGAIGAVKIKGMVSPAYIVAVPNEKIVSSYFEYQYRCPEFIQQMDRYSKGITDFRKRLYWNEFKQLVTVVPPVEEQTAIVTHIETESAKIDQAISIQQQQIDKLKEYKATLINSAVTGKIKVA
ncbi:restriction endonuclease subunit S [Methylobacter tundripaludum]|uniref:Restriction modification system DNA specificity domain protein n=1 Tax=Methylobacter tundripaludum (strain ATCC BAA-1195 / DSM 17260 / SV96) TaxID=697282 RepID=G3IWU1_METTV|nr:restriction endonuclease subunit S [Methylobacter tundripaludum]EGW23150.1 restriction modification system DNA specificity domain protein [Methylobacter tundripaludum SV96]